jgi:TfoX/Sxy family transcriptional regulator of competence genes
MAWVKVPAEHHPLFLAALPRDPRVTQLQMFGGIAVKANGRLFGGLFGRSIIVRLSPEDRERALALDGAAPFDPMGNGRGSRETIAMPEAVMDEPEELRDWLARALAYALSQPAKPVGPPKAKPKAGARAKPAAKPARTTKPAAKPARAKRKPARP